MSTRGPGKPRSRIMSRSGASDGAPTDCTVVKPAMSVTHALSAMPSAASAGGFGARRDVSRAVEVRVEVDVRVDPAGQHGVAAEVDGGRARSTRARRAR